MTGSKPLGIWSLVTTTRATHKPSHPYPSPRFRPPPSQSAPAPRYGAISAADVLVDHGTLLVALRARQGPWRPFFKAAARGRRRGTPAVDTPAIRDIVDRESPALIHLSRATIAVGYA